jgi:hypothetical protein
MLGFGPVVPDGVGIAFEVQPDSNAFTLSVRTEFVWASRLCHLDKESLLEMKSSLALSCSSTSTRLVGFMVRIILPDYYQIETISSDNSIPQACNKSVPLHRHHWNETRRVPTSMVIDDMFTCCGHPFTNEKIPLVCPSAQKLQFE